MFFTDDVLVSRGGKFAIIWIAATRKQRLRRKDCDNVDLPKTCRELRKHFRPSCDGKMTTIRGFSLRLSAQLVYGVSVVYNMKVVNLYKEASLSIQSLYRFQSQLQLYPVEMSAIKHAPATVPQTIPETFRNEDPMYGLPPEDIEIYLNRTSSSEAQSEGSRSSTHMQPVLKERGVRSLRDLSSITLPEDLPQIPIFTSFGDQLLEGDVAMGSDMIAGMLDMDNMYTSFLDTEVLTTGKQAAQNITTPAAGIQTDVMTPERPSKGRQTASSPKSKSSDETLAMPISSPASKISGEHEAVVAEMANVSFDVSIPKGLNGSSSDALSHSTLDLVLPPLQDRPADQRQGTRARSSLIVDSKIEIHSDIIRAQLMAPKSTMEEYIREGNMDVLPSTLPSAKELFEHPCVTCDHIAPTHQDPYRSAKSRQRPHVLPDAPQELFEEIVKNLPSHVPHQAKPARFSAHHAVYEEAELLRPEDEYEALQNGPTYEPNITESSVAVGDDTVMTEGSSVQGLRNLSRTTGLPASFGPLIADEVSGVEPGLSMNLEESHFQSDLQTSLRQPEPEFPEPPVQPPRTISDLIPSCSATWSQIYEFAQATDDELLFNTLAPPYVTSRKQAAQMFFNVLMLAKSGKLSLEQDQSFGVIKVGLKSSF